MDKGTTNSGLPVFGEIIKLLDKQRINTLADKMKANRYTKRLDAYQHLVIMLYAQLGQFESLRDIELGFLCAASRRTMAQDYPEPKPKGRYFATAGALPTKRGAQF